MTEENNYDRSGEPGRGQIALRSALPLLLFTICAIGGASVLAVRNFVNLSGSASIYDATAVVCAGEPAPDTAVYDPTASDLQKVVAFRQLRDGRLQIDSTVIPPAWQPASLDETALVLCLTNERTAFRAQCAEDGSDSPFTTEYGREITAVLRSASNGDIVAEGQISSVPNARTGCLDELPDEPPPNDDIPLENIQQWLAPYVQE